MILIGLGANLPHPEFGPPQATLAAALRALAESGIQTVRRSSWYRSAPVPRSDQPWFVNGVAEVAADLSPADLLAGLHQIEARFGRRRRNALEASVLDLDLRCVGDLLLAEGDAPGGLVLPHPRLHQRAFVLVPLAELAPDWRHPGLDTDIATLIARLDPSQTVELLEGAGSAAD